MLFRNVFLLSLAIFALTACGAGDDKKDVDEAQARQATVWDSYGGDGGRQYSPLTDITPDNVKGLKKVWTYHTGDMSDGSPGHGGGTAFENTPIVVDGLLYLCSPYNRVIALDPATGLEKWTFDPEIDTSGYYSNQFVCRGVSTWLDADKDIGHTCRRIIFTATNHSRLIALDAADGKLCKDFGDGGQIDLSRGVGEKASQGEYHMTSPPAVVGDIVVVGSAIGDNGRTDAPSGVVRAYDTRTGAQVWAWDLAPPDFDYETGLTSEEGFALGSPNVWAPIAVDEERDVLYLPTGNPAPDYYRLGGPAMDYYGSSVVALKGATGEILWSYQTVHHDHWDFDVPAQPTLINMTRNGEIVPALVQATKMGLLFVLNRETGEPLFEVEERAVSQNGPPGSALSPTQPFPVLPPSLVNTTLEPDDAWGITFWDKGKCRKIIESLRFEGMYTPANEEWTLMYPGNAGGINWGGIAADPKRQIIIANTMDVAWRARVIPRADFGAARADNPGIEHGPMLGTPYGFAREMIVSPLGIPCSTPPWGKLSAVDLRTGEILWDVPLGTIRDVSPVPIPWKLGVPGLGGPIITGGGVVFIGAAMDNYLRAFDLATGEELWKGRLPAGGQATPMTYSVTREDGTSKQFVVIAAGGHARAGTTLGDSLVAFSLP